MTKENIRQTIRFAQWVALTFILVLGGLLARETFQAERTLPAGLARIDEMKEGDVSDPELAETVRQFDYLYRATWFQTRDRRAYGFLLLGVGLTALCALFAADLFFFRKELKIPDKEIPSTEKIRHETLLCFLIGALLFVGSTLSVRLVFYPARPETGGPLADRDVRQTKSPEKMPPTETTAVPQTTLAETPTETKLSETEPTKAAPGERSPSDLDAALESERDQWPQFRGSLLPNRAPLPKNWDFEKKWTAAIPLAGFNSPVVWGDRVFLAGGDQSRRAVFCYSAESGEQLWEIACESAPSYPEVGEDTGISPSTLCVDGQRVYAIFGTGEMVCAAHDGKEVWRKQLPTPVTLYGYASSLLLMGDKLIVQYDLEKSQTLYALDARTGGEVWKTERESAISWSSPVGLVKDGKGIIFTAGNRFAEGFDLETGRSLWKQEVMGGEVATSAFPGDGVFYFSNSGAITGAFDAATGEILFQNDEVPAPDVASPMVSGDVFLLFTSGGSVLGVDAKDGTELYEEVFDNGFYASAVPLAGKVVAADQGGELYLLSATKEKLTTEGRFSVGTGVFAVPAFYRGTIIVRTVENELICLESKP